MSVTKSTIEITCKFSKDKFFRYYLERKWNADKPKALFILMNPSKGTSLKLDNTICNIVNYCVENGYGAFRIINLFPFMATSPKDLSGNLKLGESENNKITINSIKLANSIYIAWGNEKKYIKRKRKVEEILTLNKGDKKIYCWQDSRNNFPKHLRIMSSKWKKIIYKNKYYSV